MLPGMGIMELEFALWIQREMAVVLPSDPDLDLDLNPAERQMIPAWKLVNSELAEDEAAYRKVVLKAVAESMEDMVATLLQVSMQKRVFV